MFICHPYGKILTIKYNYYNILDAVEDLFFVWKGLFCQLNLLEYIENQERHTTTKVDTECYIKN